MLTKIRASHPTEGLGDMVADTGPGRGDWTWPDSHDEDLDSKEHDFQDIRNINNPTKRSSDTLYG